MQLTNVSSRYGAPMGRRSTIHPDRFTMKLKFRMKRLRWVDGDYDSGGAYWGGAWATSSTSAKRKRPTAYIQDQRIATF